MKKLIFHLLLLLSLTLNAQKFNSSKLDSLLKYVERSQKGMGSLSIFRNGNEVYRYTIGFADLDRNIITTSNTRYRIASITKTYTATLIMQLIEEGKLRLDTKLASFFSGFENGDLITIKQMLQHRSGLINFTNTSGYRRYMESPISKKKLLHEIKDLGCDFEPNEKSVYSNSNYVLLGFIIEHIEGKSFNQVLQERIIKKLQLKDTYIGTQIGERKNEAFSYTILKHWKPATETNMSFPLAAGAIVATPSDINRFYSALFNGELISVETLKIMETSNGAYGIGLWEMPFFQKSGFGHTGCIDGFQSYAIYLPNDKLSIAYTSNGVGMPVEDLMRGVLSVFFSKEYEFPDFKEAINVTSESLDQYLGVYSSPSFLLNITISAKGNHLIGQATGKSSFSLEHINSHNFKSDEAGFIMEFIPDEKKMIFKHGLSTYELIKE